MGIVANLQAIPKYLEKAAGTLCSSKQIFKPISLMCQWAEAAFPDSEAVDFVASQVKIAKSSLTGVSLVKDGFKLSRTLEDLEKGEADWLDLSIKVTSVASKTFKTINWLRKQGYGSTIGSEAKVLGTAFSSASKLLSGVQFAESLINSIGDPDAGMPSVAEMIQAFISIVMTLWCIVELFVSLEALAIVPLVLSTTSFLLNYAPL